MSLKMISVLAAACLGVFCAASLPVQASSALDVPSSPTVTAAQKPLMVIRFNQPRVAYERALYETLSHALELRPNALFDIVMVSPLHSLPERQKRADLNAVQNGNRVLATLKEMGMPDIRLSVVTDRDATITPASSEVRIYIR